MTIIEAIQSKLPIRRKDKGFSFINEMNYGAMSHRTYIIPNSWIDPEFFLAQMRLTKEDILADDWEVKLDFEMEYIK